MLSATCSASSRVGVRIRPWIPLSFSTFLIIPAPKANVFPDPVAEPAMTSLPSMIRGIVFSWISEGFVNFLFEITFKTCSQRPISLNFSILLEYFLMLRREFGL